MIRNIVSTAALIGREVHTETPDLNGQLEEIMIDTENGVVLFAVVSFERLHGRGESLVVIPWELIEMDLAQGGDGLIVHADREHLESVRIKAQNLPNFADPQFAKEVYEHFGV
jgi:hypothetical protein